MAEEQFVSPTKPKDRFFFPLLYLITFEPLFIRVDQYIFDEYCMFKGSGNITIFNIIESQLNSFTLANNTDSI